MPQYQVPHSEMVVCGYCHLRSTYPCSVLEFLSATDSGIGRIIKNCKKIHGVGDVQQPHAANDNGLDIPPYPRPPC